MPERPPTSFRLSPECRALIEQLKEKTGLKWSAIMESAIREYAERKLQAEPPPTLRKPTRSKKPKE